MVVFALLQVGAKVTQLVKETALGHSNNSAMLTVLGLADPRFPLEAPVNKLRGTP